MPNVFIAALSKRLPDMGIETDFPPYTFTACGLGGLSLHDMLSMVGMNIILEDIAFMENEAERKRQQEMEFAAEAAEQDEPIIPSEER